MGWLFYSPTHTKWDGKRYVIDRKAECDDIFIRGNNDRFTVLKSSMVGSTYYAAVSINKVPNGKDANGNTIYRVIPEPDREVFACVILTSVYNGDFGYKDMDETCGPGECKCPVSILKLLTPTTNKYALSWRQACQKYAEDKKNSPGKLPIGTVIEFKRNGKTITLTKCKPAYQFKTPWWYNSAENTYFPKAHLPNDFTIVSRPD